MNKKPRLWLMALPALLMALYVQAHDPSEHADEAEKPKCPEMKNMDHSKMDKDDPVMQAIMKKCMGKMHHDDAESGPSKRRHSEPDKSDDTESESKHDH